MHCFARVLVVPHHLGLAMLALVLVDSLVARSLAVDVQFVVDSQQSELTIEASTVVGFPLSDTATQALDGTIDLTLEFAPEGAFPATGEITANGAAISPVQPFSLTLGLPPLGVNVVVAGAVADVTTPLPPGALTRLSESGIVYQFDAAEMDVTLDQGTVTVSGAVNQAFDLMTTPVSGTPDTGTFGTLTLVESGSGGPLTTVNAQVNLPIVFSSDVDVEGQIVTLDVSGSVVANSSFAVLLNPLPGDFDGDGDVDGDDLDLWQASVGVDAGADANGDGTTDGDDFVLWQRNAGTTPPVAAAVPEPSALPAALMAGFSLWTRSRRR